MTQIFKFSKFQKLPQDYTDTFDWTRLNKNTPSSGTGPDSDHTTGVQGKGYFAYIESSGHVGGDYAVLMSGKSPSTRGSCLKFWLVLVF